MTPEIKELIRKEYHHLDTFYFNTAYFGPSPYSAKQKVSRALQKELDPSFYNYNTWMGVSERIRIQLAGILDCNPDHITHSTSTSDIVNIVANGYKFEKDDVVVAIDKDYPSNILPWMRAVETRNINFELLNLGDQIVPTPEWLDKNLPKNTKIFNVSHVTFDTGKKVDILGIGKLLRERGILFIVDATQSLGGMEITSEELSYIDVLAASSYKWMLGPYGHAFGYFSDRALEVVEHRNGNWIVSPKSKVVYQLLDYTTETLPGARKYDRGQASNMLSLSCLEAGLDLLSEIGLEKVRRHNQKVRDYFLENYPKSKFELITPLENMGNIVSIKTKGVDPLELERELKFRNVDVSVRQGNIRLSFHVFNTEEQVNTLIEALDI
ncbi:MAG: aminotransferase class V-fold PLP-dependent enzyme [Bacteriovoracaceae bacterium]|nr:aminotransferase class V-fold PLP-dependent enzyme [Bacteriovoracaceae bacterium]